MDKKIKYLVFIFTLMNLIEGYAQNKECDYFLHENKNDIIKCLHMEKRMSDKDTLTINIEGKELFIVKQLWGFGIPRVHIYLYVRVFGKSWHLECLRPTSTNRVNVEVDQECREVVFKSVSGKTIMILPFETISSNFDIIHE